MSQAQQGDEIDIEQFVERYTGGDDATRYKRFITEVLGVELTEPQREIVEAVADNRRVAVVGANGFGKSYTMAALNLAFLFCNPDSLVMATGASYSQLKDTMADPMQGMLQRVKNKTSIFDSARWLKNPPRIEIEQAPERFFKATSVKNSGELEGRHADHVLVTIEETDKKKIDRDIIDSATSSLTDDNDRIVAIGNPPKSEQNSFNDLIESDAWETVEFSSFASRNARIDAGVIDADESAKVPGLVGLQMIKDDWVDFNDEEWPGWDDAKASHERTDLDTRWYRRRLGVIPPVNASVFRPYDTQDVAEAEERFVSEHTVDDISEYDVVAVDVGRAGDRTVLVGANSEYACVIESMEAPGDHSVNKELIQNHVEQSDQVRLVIDSIGEGSGLADLLPDGYDVVRFDSRGSAYDQRHYNRRSQAYGDLGDWLSDGAIKPNTEMADELKAVARVMEYEERGASAGSSLKVTSKSDIKDSPLGRSPDFADAIAMAVWGVQNVVSNEFIDPGYSSARYDYR